MVDDLNPYAPPPLVAEYVSPAGYFGESDGLWRQGKLLVMLKEARLPPRCVKSNQPTNQFLKRNLTWHPQWVLLLILINILICAIVAMIMQKKATIYIGLSPEWIARRRTCIMIAWGIAALAIVMFVGGIVLAQEYDPAAILIGISPLLLIGAAIYGLVGSRMVAPTKIDDRFVWLKGVCPEFLAKLPEWTGPRA